MKLSQFFLPTLFVVLLCPGLLTNGYGANVTADIDSVGKPPDNANASIPGILSFTRIAMDASGTRYLLGEVNNQNANGSIEAVVYFSKAGPESAYYADYIGLVGPGMGMPFKLQLVIGSIHLNLSDAKVESFATLGKPNQTLVVDYNSLILDQGTHAISGTLENKSPYDSFGIKVMAIAMDSHSQILDVVQSKPINRIPSNGSSPFVLVPMDSVASRVSLYSCFVPGQSGENVTLAAEGGHSLQLEIYGDAKVKNLKYDVSARTLSFDGQGIFPGGGFATLMIISGPDSIMNSSLTVTLNGHNATRSVVSSLQVSPGKFYKHIEVGLPFGRNSVVISSMSTVPEFPYPVLAMIVAAGSLVVIDRHVRLASRRQR